MAIPDAATRASWTYPHWVLPSENEWYKAAYHKNDGVTANYWLYPTSTNNVPYSDNPASLNYPANSANYDNDDGISGNGVNDGRAVSSPYLTDVGAYSQSLSPYGTLDQAGNVWEWNEAEIFGNDNLWARGLRGGAFGDDWLKLRASTRNYGDPTEEYVVSIGFRVASVPEPGSIILLVSGAIAALIWWRRCK